MDWYLTGGLARAAMGAPWAGHGLVDMAHPTAPVGVGQPRDSWDRYRNKSRCGPEGGPDSVMPMARKDMVVGSWRSALLPSYCGRG